jgi:hypothetical protein
MNLSPARFFGLIAVLALVLALPASAAAASSGGISPASVSAITVDPPPETPVTVKPPVRPKPVASPYRRAGMWIWYIDSSEGGNLSRIIQRARRAKIGTLYIKSGDGTSVWSQFTAAMVDRFQRAGLKVCGWQYVYGRNPVGEARVSAVAKRRGADCFVIDAETEYEGNYSGADLYIRKLRQLVGPRFRLSLSTFPYAHYHPGFPYSVFLGPGAATDNLPQVYWQAIGDTVREAVETTYTYNRMYKRPIWPVGQTYMNPRAVELLQFRRYMLNYGSAPSWWSWQESNLSEWATLGKTVGGRIPRYRPVRIHPTQRRGARGDQVVWLQQHLYAAGFKVQVTGIFGIQTWRAVRQFQRSRKMKVDGVVGNSTWNRLLRVRPVRVRWSAAKSRRLSAGVSAAASGDPASASIPPRRDEIAGAKKPGQRR